MNISYIMRDLRDVLAIVRDLQRGVQDAVYFPIDGLTHHCAVAACCELSHALRALELAAIEVGIPVAEVIPLPIDLQPKAPA